MEERTPPTPPVSAQIPLPFDDEADRPIAFALTARARRTVAPHALPALRVVPGDEPGPTPGPAPQGPAGAAEPDDDPSDTRPARARALRRAGVTPDAIADQLGVDELLVRAWTAGVVAPTSPSRAATTLVPIIRPDPERDRADTAGVRAVARDRAVRRLAEQPQLAAGLGLVAGVAELAGDAVTVTTRDPRVAGAAVRWLRDALEVDPSDVRLVLRVGPRTAADLARHRWGRAVGIAPERVRTTRAAAVSGDDDVEAVVRVVDRHLAATVAGWCDALLDGAATAAEGF